MPRSEDILSIRLSPLATLDLVRERADGVYHLAIAERGLVTHRTSVTLTKDEAMKAARFLADIKIVMPPAEEAPGDEGQGEQT